jgi:hypothetical protein
MHFMSMNVRIEDLASPNFFANRDAIPSKFSALRRRTC